MAKHIAKTGEDTINLVQPIRDKKQVREVTKYLYNYDFRYGLIWDIGIHIGLRISDILNLPLSIRNKNMITITEQKTDKKKHFPLSVDLQNKINECIEKHRSYEIPEDKHIFIGKKHAKLDRSNVYRRINIACQKIGITENVGTHTMRKTFGYHHYKQFKDVALLQTIFNHSSPAITLRYIGITQDEINESYEKLDFDKTFTSLALADLKSKTYGAISEKRELQNILTNFTLNMQNILNNMQEEVQEIKETTKNIEKPTITKIEKSLMNTIQNYIECSRNEKAVNFCKWLLEQAEANI